VSITEGLSDTIAEQIRTIGGRLWSAVAAQRLDDGKFLAIEAHLSPEVSLDTLPEVAALIRHVLARWNGSAINASDWGAVVYLQGNIVHIIHAGNGEATRPTGDEPRR